MKEIKLGIKGSAETEVLFANSAVALGSGRLQLYATPAMAALMENAAMESVQPYLEDNEGTVGIELNIQHLTPSPMGIVVTAESELVAVEGKILTFNVTCRSRREIVGKGTHKRAVVDNMKFMEKAIAKRK